MEFTQTQAGESARTGIAWRLLPFLFLLYIANYIDRTNIAYATLGMKDDLGLSDSVFGTASGIFFIGYFALQIPGALLVERWSARWLLALTLITWGALTTLTAFVHTPHQLYGDRFLLGSAEAGFFPGVIVYLSHWFTTEDRGKAIARFMSAIPIGFMIGGPVAGSILGVHWLNLAGWRWLFLMEGAPAIILGIATIFYLPDRPDQARWLAPDERDWIKTRLADERAAKAHIERITVWHDRLLPGLLHFALRVSDCRRRGRGSRFHQLHRQHRRFRRAQVRRQSQPAERLVHRRICDDDRLLDRRVRACPGLPAQRRAGMTRTIHRVEISGVDVDSETRCAHY